MLLMFLLCFLNIEETGYCFYFGLDQACTTYGPRAKCGPQKLLIWPAKPQILFILLLSHVKTPFECVKTYQLWPLNM